MARLLTRPIRGGLPLLVGLAAALFAGCRAGTAPRARQPAVPPTLLFVAAQKPYSGIRETRTLYAVRVGAGELTPEAVFTRQGLIIGPTVAGRYVILSGCTFPEHAASASPESFLYRAAEGRVEPIPLLQDTMRVHAPGAGIVVTVSGGPLDHLRVQLAHVPSMRVEAWAVPGGLADSAVGSMWSLPFHARMSPDFQRLALFVQPLRRDHGTLTSSLIVLERGGSGARVLDSGLWPEWSPIVSWSMGPDLEWVDDRRLVYVDIRGGFKGPSRSLLKIADVRTGRVRIVGPSPGFGPMRDPRDGVIFFRVPPGKRSVLHVPERGLEARLREEPSVEPFVRSRTEDATTEILRDTTRDVEVWRGRLHTLHSQYASPDGRLLAFTVRPKKTENIDDLYVYDGKTRSKQQVFSGYLTGPLHWVGASAQGDD